MSLMTSSVFINLGLELRMITGRKELHRRRRRALIYKECARQHRGSE